MNRDKRLVRVTTILTAIAVVVWYVVFLSSPWARIAKKK